MTTDDETFETVDAAISAATAQLLDDCEVWLRDRGCDEARIVRVRDRFARLLRENRAGAVAMLEARCTAVN